MPPNAAETDINDIDWLMERRDRCGKPGRHIAEVGDPGHGHGYVLNRSVNGKRSTVRIWPDEIEGIRDLLREFRRFVEASEARRREAGEGDRQKWGCWRRSLPPKRPRR